MIRINPADPRLTYSGRIDWQHEEEPVFVFPCTSVQLRFTGSHLRVCVVNMHEYWQNFLGIIADGTQTKQKLEETGETILDIPVEQTVDVHEVMLFKRQDGCHYFQIRWFEIEDGAQLLQGPDLPERRIEIYGDSVSAGEVSEAVDYTGKEDPVHEGEYNNSWYSYSWQTARMLHAQIHDIAQGGIALLDGTGWYHEPNAQGMESVWNKIEYNPVLGNSKMWDFHTWVPDVVVIAIGQNDSHPIDYMAQDEHGEQAGRWKEGYYRFLQKIRGVYPGAEIVCITTLLMHDAAWDRAIEKTVNKFREDTGDLHVTHYLFARNGVGTPGHLRIPEGKEMAEELSRYIETRLA